MLLALLGGCRTDPVDTACPGCFRPVQAFWNLFMGIQAGTFVEVGTLDGTREPVLDLLLVDEDYPTTYDPADACTLLYGIEGARGTLDPEAWQNWALTLIPRSTDCRDLPSAKWGLDPLDRFADRDWEISLEGLTGLMETYLEDLFEGQGGSWARDGAPHYFGSHTWIDAYDTASDVGQTHYGRAWQIDAEGRIVDEASGGHLLPWTDVAAGSDGYYEIFSVYYFVI